MIEIKKKVVKEIVNILNRQGYISFYLHNVRYTIINKNDEYIIKQSGCDNILKYNEITDLFQHYRIYRDSLIESLEEIIIIV